MQTLLLLALAAPLLAIPVPHRDITVRYTANYPNPPTPQQHTPPPKKDALSEADLPPSPSADELADILSVQRPLPSIFLMNLSKLRGDKAEETEEELKAREEVREVEARERPEARDVAEERPVWVSDARHLCPFAALVVFWTLGFLACAIQRWRKPRGKIYLHIEKPARESLSLRADSEVAEAQ